MSTFSISKWFEITADSYEEAWDIANGSNRKLADLAEDSGTIDVEMTEEE